MIKFCSECGVKVEFKFSPPKFCSSCGAPFGAPNNEQTKTVNRNVNKPRKIQALAEDETDVDYVPNITKLEYEIDTFGVEFGTQATIGSLMGKRPPSRKKVNRKHIGDIRDTDV